MRKGLIALALFGLLFLALMLFAPGSDDISGTPGWTRTLGRLLGGFAPRVRSLEGQTEFALAAGSSGAAVVPAAPDAKLRLLTLRHVEGGPVIATFTCNPIAGTTCKPPEATGCLGQPLDDDACQPQVEKNHPGEEVSFTVGPGGGRLTMTSKDAASRIGIVP